MIVLVVGPSGVGKSSTCKSAAEHFPQVVFRDLDGLAAKLGFERGVIPTTDASLLFEKVGDEGYLNFGLLAIDNLKAKFPDQHLVIDVGAGFQVAPSASTLHLKFPLIAITASLHAAHQRIVENRKDPRSIDHYKHFEFSTHREAVYKSARHIVDTTNGTPEQAKAEFIQALNSILMSSLPE